MPIPQIRPLTAKLLKIRLPRIQLIAAVLFFLALVATVTGILMGRAEATDRHVDSYWGTADGALRGVERQKAKRQLYFDPATPAMIIATAVSLVGLGLVATQFRKKTADKTRISVAGIGAGCLILCLVLPVAAAPKVTPVKRAIRGHWESELDNHTLHLDFAVKNGAVSGNFSVKGPRQDMCHRLEDCFVEYGQITFVVPVGGSGDEDNLLFKLHAEEGALSGHMQERRSTRKTYLTFHRSIAKHSKQILAKAGQCDRTNPESVAQAFFVAVREHNGRLAERLWAGPREEKKKLREHVESGKAQTEWRIPAEIAVRFGRFRVKDGESTLEASCSRNNGSVDMVFRDGKWWMCR